MSIGHAPEEPQWVPDKRKDDAEITEAEKKDAKRRIQGSHRTESSFSSPNDSGSGGDEAGACDEHVSSIRKPSTT